jgi:predicted glycoside hydrolase/deacetylase ChbG (UPF0249 family)
MSVGGRFRGLIVNADDFGLSDGVNSGIIAAHRRGIVTSCSLMVKGQAARAAAALAADNPSMGVGLHVDVGEWFFSNGDWVARYSRADESDAARTADEVDEQIGLFRELMGRDPTHIDSHQHAHRREPLKSIVAARARSLGIPVRHLSPEFTYCGSFYGQNDEGQSFPARLSVLSLAALIRALDGDCVELCCHPAQFVDFDSTYASERVDELRALCAAEVRLAVESSQRALVSFRAAPMGNR